MGHKEGGNSSKINSYFEFLRLGISPHREGLCLLDNAEERDDLHAEAYKEGEVLDLEVLNEMVDISFENSHGNPFQISFKYHPDNSP